ncbi:hypothetical protein ANCCAN_24263 [Ancylostoma caninum]|uniref:Uncharacterized protein n=1 Tax=Ancylostoma caninum TaxID=29170 RepID=A0A368FEH5_ANCCA|nr:hypothetical protein ANCCAN_24263 [Ancylostoma caninum]
MFLQKSRIVLKLIKMYVQMPLLKKMNGTGTTITTQDFCRHAFYSPHVAETQLMIDNRRIFLGLDITCNLLVCGFLPFIFLSLAQFRRMFKKFYDNK